MDFIPKFKEKLQKGIVADFESMAMDAFRFQFQNNRPYRHFVNYTGKDVRGISGINDIPFLPISLFKYRTILADGRNPQKVFKSSGTTGTMQSRHQIPDIDHYYRIAQKSFEELLFPLKDCHFFFLLPGYLQNSESSLVEMARFFFEESDKRHGGFFLDDFEGLDKELEKVAISDRKVILWGVTFALLEFGNQKKSQTPLIIIETGGMKGRGKELTREELHKVLNEQYGTREILGEYGMTELQSQAYSLKGGRYLPSSTLRVIMRDFNDPGDFNPRRGFGGLNFIDLANIETCPFIASEDLGKVYPDGSFEVLGRLDHSDLRGCNLLFN